MTQVKIKKDGTEVETNKGSVGIKVKGLIVKDYQNKFEMTAFKKTLRAFYEKYIIQSTIKEFKGKIATECDEFLTSGKIISRLGRTKKLNFLPPKYLNINFF